MKVAILGPGALGGLVAAYLHAGGLDVVLLDHRPDRAARLTAQGLFIEGIRGPCHVRVPVVTEAAAIGPVALVIVAVKSYRTGEAMRQHRALVGPTTLVWSIQNGLGNAEALAETVPPAQIVGGSTTQGAHGEAEGRIRHAGEGDTFLGALPGADPALAARLGPLAATLTAAGLPVQVAPDIRRVIWTKLIINVGINALTALLGVPNGRLLELPSALVLLDAAVTEAVQVAGTQGLPFEREAMLVRVREVARRTGPNRSSMLQDLERGRRTEIDHINGAIARLGAAPVNETLANLVRAREAADGGHTWNSKKSS